MKTLRVVLLFLACLLVGCFAQEGIKVTNDFEGEEPEPEVVEVGASPDVFTNYVFTRFMDKKFPSGEPVEILLVLANKGDHQFNITHVTASFNYPLDFSYYIQNFTAREYNVALAPSIQSSLAYTFHPDPLLEPRDFGLVVSVHYSDEQAVNYTSIVFNSTIDIVEPAGGVDTQTFFAYLAVSAIIGMVGFVAYRVLGSWKKRQKFTPKEFGTIQTLDN